MAALNILDVFSTMNKAYVVRGPENCINIDENDRYRHDETNLSMNCQVRKTTNVHTNQYNVINLMS